VLTDVRMGSTVRSESVKSVRVWGVGREKDRYDQSHAMFCRQSDNTQNTAKFCKVM